MTGDTTLLSRPDRGGAVTTMSAQFTTQHFLHLHHLFAKVRHRLEAIDAADWSESDRPYQDYDALDVDITSLDASRDDQKQAMETLVDCLTTHISNSPGLPTPANLPDDQFTTCSLNEPIDIRAPAPTPDNDGPSVALDDQLAETTQVRLGGSEPEDSAESVPATVDEPVEDSSTDEGDEQKSKIRTTLGAFDPDSAQ